MARRFWPNEDPIGRRIAYGSGPQVQWMEIVGIVADSRRTGYESVVRPETYQPHAQSPSGGMMLVVRASGEAQSVAPALREALRTLDPTVALQGVRPLTDLLIDMTSQRRLNTVLLAAFAVVAGLLAAVGIYGVLAYSVAARTRELGVRVALGASRTSILRLVIGEGLLLSGIGLVAGLAGALALTRTLRSLVYQVSTVDPATFAAIAGVAAMISLAACLIPAWRAVRVDPILALRAD
jgi:putative ABC transport system permease protein